VLACMHVCWCVCARYEYYLYILIQKRFLLQMLSSQSQAATVPSAPQSLTPQNVQLSDSSDSDDDRMDTGSPAQTGKTKPKRDTKPNKRRSQP
jgi:hypothetical protein